MEVVEKKEIIHESDHNKEYASKGMSGAALGLIFQVLIIVILYETLP